MKLLPLTTYVLTACFTGYGAFQFSEYSFKLNLFLSLMISALAAVGYTQLHIKYNPLNEDDNDE